MNIYLDSSALVKRYINESGSDNVERLLSEAALVATTLISRAEVSAALGKAVRLQAITSEEGLAALKQFRSHWNHLVRIKIEEHTIAKADSLAWDYSLRGYDAVQLASALLWQGALNESITFVTFDRQLWEAGTKVGLEVLPEIL
jgi:predicted nucleic acid-binding protein